MAEMEEVVILKVGTDEAVKSVADLRENIRAYKDILKEAEIGGEEYQNALKDLQINQAALKNAMHATTGTMQDVVRDATAMNVQFDEQNKLIIDETTSYNALVKKMAELDQQFRSATDAGERAKLGQQINSVNDALKKFDEDRGKFGRNVGNYKSALDGLSTGFTATAGAAKSVINPLKNMTTGLQAFSATPALAMLGLLANALTKVISGMKGTTEGVDGLNRILAAFKPIGDAFVNAIQDIGKKVADLGNKIIDLLDKYDLLSQAARERIRLQEDLSSVTQAQIDNIKYEADLEEAAAVKRDMAYDKEKYTLKQREKYWDDYALIVKTIYRNRANLAEAAYKLEELEHQKQGDNYKDLEKLNRLYAESVKARAALSDTERTLRRERDRVLKGEASSVPKITKDAAEQAEATLATVAEVLEGIDKRMDESLRARLEAEKQAAQDEANLNAVMESQWEGQTDTIQAEINAQLDAEFDAMMREREIMRQRIDVFQQFSGAVASIAGTIADIYEQDADASAEAARKAKGFKTAEAIISTLSGAVAAYVSTWTSELPLTVKSILAPVNAAAVLAAGYAQVRKIQSTSVTGTASPVAATVAAPAVTIPMQQVRTITGASEEVRLNQMASPQRVYILASDLQAERNASRVRIAETSF